MADVDKESAYIAVKEAYQRASLEAAFHHNWVKEKASDEWKVENRRERLQKSVEQTRSRRMSTTAGFELSRSRTMSEATQESDGGVADSDSMDYKKGDEGHLVPQPVSQDSVPLNIPRDLLKHFPQFP